MPENPNTQIDAAQNRLTELKEVKEKDKSAKTIEQFHKEIFTEVDELQAIDVKSPPAIQELDRGKDEVNQWLLKIVQRGIDLKNDTKKLPESTADTPQPTLPTTIESLVHALHNTTEAYSVNLLPAQEYEKSLALATAEKAKQTQSLNLPNLNLEQVAGLSDQLDNTLSAYLLSKQKLSENYFLQKLYGSEEIVKLDETINEIKNQKNALAMFQHIPVEHEKYVTVEILPKGQPHYVLTAEGKKLKPEEQQKILEFSSAVEGTLKQNTDNQIDLLSSPPQFDHYWQGMMLIRFGKFAEGKKMLQTFLEEDLKKPELKANPALAEKSIKFELQAKETLKEVQETEQKNQKYFDGLSHIQGGNATEGKRLLLEYIQEMESQSINQNPQAPKYLEVAKEVLKKVALLKIQEIIAKMAMHEPPLVPTDSPMGGGPQAGTDQTMVDPVFTRSVEALQQMEAMIQSGLFLTYEDAYNVITVQGTDPPKDAEFTYLADEIELDAGGEKSRQKLLELARKYRYKNPALSEKYFTTYFAKQLAQTTKEVTFESIQKECTSGEHQKEFEGSLKALMERAKAEYDQQSPEFKAQNPWNTQQDEYPKRLQEMLSNQAVETIYTRKIQEKQQEKYRINPSSLSANPSDQQAWEEFMDMKGLTHSGTWKSFLDPSDEQAWELITQLPVKIAIVAVSAKTAGLAGAAFARAAAATSIGETALTATTQWGARLAASRLGERFVLSSTGSFLRNVAGLTIENTVAKAPFHLGAFGVEERVFSTNDTLLNALYFDALQKGEFDPLKIYQSIPGWGQGVTGLGAFKGVGFVSQLGKIATLGSGIYKSAGAISKLGIAAGLETTAVGSQFATTAALNKLHTGSGRLSTHDIAFVLGLHGTHSFGEKPKPNSPSPRPRLQLLESTPSGPDTNVDSHPYGANAGPKTEFSVPEFNPRPKTQPGEPIPEAFVTNPKAPNQPHPNEGYPKKIETSEGTIINVIIKEITGNPDNVNIYYPDGRVVEMPKDELSSYTPSLRSRIKAGEISFETYFEVIRRLRENPNDTEVLNGLSSHMRDPVDLKILLDNLNHLTHEQCLLIIEVGSKIETVPSEDGKTETSYRIFSSTPFTKGGMGEVGDVMYTEGNSTKINEGVIKRPRLDRMEFFEDDTQVCKQVQKVIDENPDDPRAKHVLRPSVIGKNFTIFPKVKDKSGKSRDLQSLGYTADTKEMAENWEGVSMGLDFLSEKGILAVDNKPANTMVGAEGGMIIDVGGLIFINRYRPNDPTSDIQIIDSKQFGEAAVTVNLKTGIQTHLITTPNYTDRSIMTKEVKGELPPDQTNKLSLAMSIESYLVESGFMGAKHMAKFQDPFNNRTGAHEAKTGAGEPDPKDYVDKSNIPPGKLAVNLAQAPKEVIQLYNLYVRLYESRRHPYEYKNNDPNQGKDPMYISLGQATKIFAQIARTP